jgi:hypothetical protein
MPSKFHLAAAYFERPRDFLLAIAVNLWKRVRNMPPQGELATQHTSFFTKLCFNLIRVCHLEEDFMKLLTWIRSLLQKKELLLDTPILDIKAEFPELESL